MLVSTGWRELYRCDCQIIPVRGQWVIDDSVRGTSWIGEDPGYDFEKLYNEEYKPYWRSGFSIEDVVARRADTRAAQVWGGVTWLEDLKYSTAKPPVWWNDEARQKTLIGHQSPTIPNQWNGGHKAGLGKRDKTEFPERWTDKDIDLILAETWENPTAVRLEGDRRRARRVIDEVLVQIEAYGKSYENFRTYFSVGGRGVIYNGRDKRSKKRIPGNTKGWEVIDG